MYILVEQWNFDLKWLFAFSSSAESVAGNPVSAAAGLAILDVIEREKAPNKAKMSALIFNRGRRGMNAVAETGLEFLTIMPTQAGDLFAKFRRSFRFGAV